MSTPAESQALFNAATTVNAAANAHHVPNGLLWGIMLTAKAPAGKSLHDFAGEVAAKMAAAHAKSNKWDTAVSYATGGTITDAQATNANNRLPVGHALGEPSAEAVTDLLKVATVLGGAVAAFVVGPAVAVGGGAAAAGDAAAGGGGAAAGDAAAAGGGAAAGTAAEAGIGGGLLGGLSSKLLAGGLIGALVAGVSGYGVRLLEIIGGGLLVLLALYTLAKGETPSLPRTVPVP